MVDNRNYMRSSLCGVLLSYPAIASALLEDSDLQSLGKLLRDVSEEYVVNHVDTLWIRVNCLRQRISFSVDLSDDVTQLLPPEHVGKFLVEANAHRKGRSALQDGVRVWGAARGGYVELHVRLDVDASTVVVEGGSRTS